MKKYKELIKNMGILTISNFGSKLLVFFLIPIYTSVLTTTEYGEFDLIQTTVSLLIPLLTVCISDAVIVYLLDKKYKDKDVCNIGLKITFISVMVVIILCTINHIFDIVPIVSKYAVYFILMYTIYSVSQLVQNISRGLDKIFNIGIFGLLESILMIILNIVFLVKLKLGIEGYFLAYILSSFISTMYLVISLNVKKYVTLKKMDKKLKSSMITYSRPLIFNSIGWWINNVSDRYFVTYMCGFSENGIYSVSYKIPSILSIIQTIFNQAWTISAVKNYETNKKDNFIKNIYEVYNLILFLGCSILIILNKFIAHFLYQKEFFVAWKYTPYLMISIIFSSISGLLGGIFAAEHDSKVIGRTTMFGAIVNIILNFILIYFMGTIGAAIATMISYFVVWVIRHIKLKKYLNLNLDLKKSFVMLFIVLFQTILFYIVKNNVLLYSLEFILFILLVICNNQEIKFILKKIKSKKRNDVV